MEAGTSLRPTGSGRPVLVVAKAWIIAERRQGAALILGRRALVFSHGRRANRSRWVAVRGLESISDRGVHIGAYSPRPSWAGQARGMIAVVSPKQGSRAAVDDNGDAHGLLRFGLRLPVAWLNTYGRRRHVGPWSQEFSPAGSPASGDPDRHSSRMRLRRQNSWLLSGRSAALALRPRLAGYGSVPSSRP